MPNVDGYVAKADNEAVLTIRQVCLAMKERGGFVGNFDELVENIRLFLIEMAYQLCDGFAVNLEYFSIHPNIGGVFSSNKETYDPKKNPVREPLIK
ncbi:MAG: hypothetical protein LBH43_14730 [Treponema sp.]|nr:hypothetical protein [Treponema sp.]